jgi:hypothetical protein
MPVPTVPESQVKHTFGDDAVVEVEAPTSGTTNEGLPTTMFSSRVVGSEGSEEVQVAVVAPLVVLAGGISALDLGSEAALTLGGGGFLAGSSISVYMFSSPTLLGVIRVAADGTYSAELDLPDSLRESGSLHTLRMVGYSPTGSEWIISSPVWLDPLEASVVNQGGSSGPVTPAPAAESENATLPETIAQGDAGELPGMNPLNFSSRSADPTSNVCSAMSGYYGFGFVSATKVPRDCLGSDATLALSEPRGTPVVSFTLWLYAVAAVAGTFVIVTLIGRRKTI